MSKDKHSDEEKGRPMGKGTLTLETKRLEIEEKKLEMAARVTKSVMINAHLSGQLLWALSPHCHCS